MGKYKWTEEDKMVMSKIKLHDTCTGQCAN